MVTIEESERRGIVARGMSVRGYLSANWREEYTGRWMHFGQVQAVGA